MGQGKWIGACAFGVIALGALVAAAEDDAAEKAAIRHLAANQGVLVDAGGTEAAYERIEGILAQPLKSPLEFAETPLNTVMGALVAEYDLPIQFDVQALEAIAQSPDVEVTVNIASTSLRSALELILRTTADLDYMIDDEVLVITTLDEVATRLEVRVYRVDDLISLDSDTAAPDYDSLIEVVTSTIDAESWSENGTGEGEILPIAPGMLVVSQTHRVQLQIGKAFHTLRQVKADILADAGRESDDGLVTRGVAIKADVAQSATSRKVIRDAVMQSVDWNAASEELGNKAFLNVLPSRVFVRHRADMVRQVVQALHDLSVTAPSTQFGGGSTGGGLSAQ